MPNAFYPTLSNNDLSVVRRELKMCESCGGYFMRVAPSEQNLGVKRCRPCFSKPDPNEPVNILDWKNSQLQ